MKVVGACPLPSRWPSYSLWHIWVQLRAGPHDWGNMERGTEEGQGQALQPEKMGKHGPAWHFQALAALRRCFLTAQPLLWPSSRSQAEPMVTVDWILLQALISNPQHPRQRASPMASDWGGGVGRLAWTLGSAVTPQLGPSTQQKPERDTERGCVVTTKRLMGTSQDCD